MATQAITLTAFKLLLADAADAIAAGNWALATGKYAQAVAVNCALVVEVESAGERIQRKESLAELKTAIDAARSSSGLDAGESHIITTRTRHNY